MSYVAVTRHVVNGKEYRYDHIRSGVRSQKFYSFEVRQKIKEDLEAGYPISTTARRNNVGRRIVKEIFSIIQR